MSENTLKQICEEEGVRQSELCAESGVTYGTINKVYNNKRVVATVTKAKLAKALTKLSGKEYAMEDVFPASSHEQEPEKDVLDELVFGPTTYHFLRPLQKDVSRTYSQTWECSVEGLSPRFEGSGKSAESAERSFLSKVHSAFQSLVHLRPFRMTEEQRNDWSLLESLIDVPRYWESVPLKLIETGIVKSIDDDGWFVVWLDGDRVESINAEQAPPEFGAFKPGEWFEALVERTPDTHDLQKMPFARAIQPVHEMSEQELREWWDSLPTGEDLPRSDSELASL